MNKTKRLGGKLGIVLWRAWGGEREPEKQSVNIGKQTKHQRRKRTS
jgi:hypothetical protein